MTLEKRTPRGEPKESAGPQSDSCPYCGTSPRQGSVKAKCSVCGMAITENHFPHIIRVNPGEGVIHFCSLVCMFNYEHIEDGDTDG